MRTTIVGANGGIGRILSKQLADENSVTPVAMIRRASQKEYFNEVGVDTIQEDLESSLEDLTRTFSGSDAIVFTAGSGGSTGYDKTLEIDLDAAVKSVEAAEKAGVDRFIMVSVINADDRKAWDSSPIKPYMIAKHYADRALKNSSLDHTILRPGSLREQDGNNKISTDPSSADSNSIPREDVASAITECLRSDSGRNRIFEIVSGDTKISEALNS